MSRHAVISCAVVLGMVCAAFASASDSVKVLTRKDNASSVRIAAGDRLTIELPGNPTTGFMWSVVSVDTASFRISEAEVIRSGAKRNVVGAPSLFRWHVEALKESSGTIKLAYARSWEKVPPAEVFSVTLVSGPRPQPKKK